jgi:proton-dependent oligopeptide transporter, POT family
LNTSDTAVQSFPRILWVTLLLEFVERAAFYGVYINLAIYLSDTVQLTAAESGLLMGWFAALKAWSPLLTGALADRLGFRKSLLISFFGYAGAYASLFLMPYKVGACIAVILMSLAGAFLKPVVPAVVRKYSPIGREQEGFSLFYASVNAGSVVGKVLTFIVRTLTSIRVTIGNAVVWSGLGLVLTYMLFREPSPKAPDRNPLAEDKQGYRTAAEGPESKPKIGAWGVLKTLGRQPRFWGFLILVSGYYLLIEQFYQTFPVHVVRVYGAKAPRELITLINPAAIALLQVPIGRLTKKLPAMVGMSAGIAIGAVSMLLMGMSQSLLGVCLSFFMFALAEMVYSPRYYQYTSSFAPAGGEALTVSLSMIPMGLGGLVGGVLSGRLIALYYPKEGALNPFAVWSIYAVIGALCAVMLAVFGILTRKPAESTTG